jgi:hypothetical protein
MSGVFDGAAGGQRAVKWLVLEDRQATQNVAQASKARDGQVTSDDWWTSV